MIMKRRGVPCYGCTDRNAECHSICALYSDYKQKQEEEKRIIEAAKVIIPARRLSRWEY